MTYPIPAQRTPARAETTPEQPRTTVFLSPSGGRLLVTVWPDGSVELAQRIGQRWSAPFAEESA